MIRVGRTKNNRGACSYPGFTTIIVTTKSRSGPYTGLSPYYLYDEKKRNMENLWQFAKIYKEVPDIKVTANRWDPTVIWEWGSETHVDDNDNPTEEYWTWRENGMAAPDPIRYPVGFAHRTKCVGAYAYNESDDTYIGPLDYIESRKQIYQPVYTKLVKQTPEFAALQKRYRNNENLLIVDVDGPVQDSMEYYKEKYAVSDDWIHRNSIEVTPENMEILLNDEKHPFGHGFCLALELMN